ncbi:hypothetical protein BDN72DRAFT_775506 [Pluteus cervinus]|uniref:Uncharacterized protein n=1 Tax=Pluteus cervinus TaxID=181527 RepID=A0ACD3AEE2_9AGAR|nr:hypothetical protein BDN72DRAFT_775506 [Pluteus cervinus]
MHWSLRKGTQAAQKLPINWEDQCERSAMRKAYVIKEEDIPPQLWVNSDQTKMVYAPGGQLTWGETGAKQIQVLGNDEKRAITVFVSVSSDGTLLPMQVIYGGKSARSCPTVEAPHYTDLVNEGFLLQESGTTTYWSTLGTMKTFVDKILAPYFEKWKKDLGLSPLQKSFWTIDAWSVHRSQEFRAWMRKEHPTIILDYVPGGCTGVAQPCDVGIQRPFKLSIKRSYHEDVVADILEQFDEGVAVVRMDTRLPTIREKSTRWIWNAYRALSDRDLVKKVAHFV